jgi:hypothetical protein
MGFVANTAERGGEAMVAICTRSAYVDLTLLRVYWLDKETHPGTLLPLGHGQHDITRLAINLVFLALRRKGKFEILEERQNYDLHFKNTANNVNRPIVAQSVRVLTRTASRYTHECRSLKISKIRRRQIGRVSLMRTEAHPAERHQPSAVEMSAYSRVAKEPNVGRRFLEFPFSLWI